MLAEPQREQAGERGPHLEDPRDAFAVTQQAWIGGIPRHVHRTRMWCRGRHRLQDDHSVDVEMFNQTLDRGRHSLPLQRRLGTAEQQEGIALRVAQGVQCDLGGSVLTEMVTIEDDRGPVTGVVEQLVNVECTDLVVGQSLEKVLVNQGLGLARVAVAAEGDQQGGPVVGVLV